ncbi:quercetin 3-O-methyltransferase 1 protein [Rutstroemia sp. NJR-2017a BBW]|nr:quercetin 3-O-methyltransferase 1 protein [Rutstroemia sp. NJR-2017a BBW]
MRFVVAMGFFKELGPGRYIALPLSNALVSSAPFGQAMSYVTSQNGVILALPSYFAQNGYKSPDDAYDSPFQFAHNTKLHAFEWLATQPRLQHAFNVLMTMPRGGPNDQKWFDYYPTASKLQVTSTSEVVLVDIGGGVGHDVIALQKRFPDLRGQYIVQDIPVVVDSITSLPTGISAQKHDFFSPQPVKNAKAYYLSNILHDWPDKQARKILHNITDAMGEDSLVLISENVTPEENVDIYSASADFAMMANFSALERTEKQFKELLDSAGLRLVGVYMSENAANGKDEQKARRLLEAVKKA